MEDCWLWCNPQECSEALRGAHSNFLDEISINLFSAVWLATRVHTVNEPRLHVIVLLVHAINDKLIWYHSVTKQDEWLRIYSRASRASDSTHLGGMKKVATDILGLQINQRRDEYILVEMGPTPNCNSQIFIFKAIHSLISHNIYLMLQTSINKNASSRNFPKLEESERKSAVGPICLISFRTKYKWKKDAAQAPLC